MAQNDHPLESARKSLDDAIPLLTRNPNTTANVFIEKQTAEREALEQLTDKELLNEAVREIATTAIIISRALRHRVNTLIPTKIGELAVLLRSLAISLSAVATGFRQAADMPPQNTSGGRGTRLVLATCDKRLLRVHHGARSRIPSGIERPLEMKSSPTAYQPFGGRFLGAR